MLPETPPLCVCQSALGGNQSLRLHLCFSVKAKFGSSASKKDQSGTFCSEGALCPHRLGSIWGLWIPSAGRWPGQQGVVYHSGPSTFQGLCG